MNPKRLSKFHVVKCSKHEISDIKEFPKNLKVEDVLIRSSNVATLMIAQKIGKEKFQKFIDKTKLLNSPDLQLEEVGSPIDFEWNKCKLETVSFGHGITTTPLQATTVYASLANGGNMIQPNLIKKLSYNKKNERLVAEETSMKLNNILRKVVTDEKALPV